jgi:hypothetical protein
MLDVAEDGPPPYILGNAVCAFAAELEMGRELIKATKAMTSFFMEVLQKDVKKQTVEADLRDNMLYAHHPST